MIAEVVDYISGVRRIQITLRQQSMSHQLNCAQKAISCIDWISVVCSGNSETWLVWPHSGISLQAQSHANAVSCSLPVLVLALHGNAYAVHYRLVEVVTVEVASFNAK